MEDSEKFYSVGEFARLIGRSQSYVRTLCDKGVITCYRPTGKRFIPASAIEEIKVRNTSPRKGIISRPTCHCHGSELRVIPTYKRVKI